MNFLQTTESYHSAKGKLKCLPWSSSDHLKIVPPPSMYKTRLHVKGRKQQLHSCSSQTEMKLAAKFPRFVVADFPPSSSPTPCLLLPFV
jgi:hypothetical protein